MVLVDTSVWIELFRKRNSIVGELLYQLTAENQAAICGQIYVEFIGGFRKAKLRKEYSSSFAKFPFIDTIRQDFIFAAELLADCPRLGPGDAVIAAIAINHKIPLFTLDRDFSVLATTGLGLIKI